MKKVLLNVTLGFVFGLPAIFVFILAGEAFEVHGGSSTRELASGCLATALYLAYCEFWVAPRGVPGFGPKAPTVVATMTPLLMTIALFDRRAIVETCVPLFIAGLAGTLAGAYAAERAYARHATGSQVAADRTRACRRMLLAGASMLVAAALLVALGVIPPVTADTSNFATPRRAAEGFWVVAGLNLLAAVPPSFAAMGRQGRGRYSSEILAFPAVLALLVGITILAPAIDFIGHGPGMHAAAALLFLCTGLNLLATMLLTAASIVAERTLPALDQRT